MINIYSAVEGYPNRAGYSDSDTSKQAAEKINSRLKQLQKEVLTALSCHSFGATAEQVAFWMNIPPETVKPRLSELKRLGLVRKTDRRGRTALNGSCVIWEAV